MGGPRAEPFDLSQTVPFLCKAKARCYIKESSDTTSNCASSRLKEANYVTTPILPSLALCDSASASGEGVIAANGLDQNYTWVFYAEFEVGDIADEANIIQ